MADDRPQYQHGVGTIGGTQFHWGSGTPGKYWSVPYGDYPVTPDAPTGAWAQSVGAIPIANNVIPDPKLGRDRIGIMIHSGSSDSLDQLYTQGCFKVAPQEWPAVRTQILAEAKKGPLYLHVQPGGVASFTNTKTMEQASIPTASAPGPIAGALAAQETGPESAGSNQAYTFALPENAPAGMRNHNPLNIKYYKGAEKDYGGLVGPSENTDQGDPQMKFSSPEAGWNAAYKLLSKKYGAGKTTPNMIIAGKGGWTPGNTQAAANVAKAAGIGPDDDIDFSNPARAQAFMRALAQQEQGGAAKAYPDAMIASAVGGTAPASGMPATTGTPATAIATAAPAAADQPWWSKFVTPPTDKEGQPIEGAKSPVEKAIGAFTGSDNLRARMEAQAPAGDGGFGQGPGARNVSPGLQNIAQTYGQTINSLMQPLTWSSGPPRIGGMAPAGSQAWAAPVSGISLNSVQAPPEGLGYGISSNYGLG